MNNNKIGIFDSGIGGVTVLREIIKVLPNEDIYYFSDSKNNPYGDKKDEEILEICNNIVDRLIKENCKAIVIACNTASAKAATKGTIESEKFHKLYNKYNNHNTELLECVGLADIIEEGNEQKIKEYLKENLSKYKGDVKNVVLGCTHYPLIEKEIKEVLGDVEFFNGAASLSKHLKDILIKNNLINDKIEKGNIEFVDSSNLIKKRERFFKYLENIK